VAKRRIRRKLDKQLLKRWRVVGHHRILPASPRDAAIVIRVMDGGAIVESGTHDAIGPRRRLFRHDPVPFRRNRTLM
jgi:hypothetical protein